MRRNVRLCFIGYPPCIMLHLTVTWRWSRCCWSPSPSLTSKTRKVQNTRRRVQTCYWLMQKQVNHIMTHLHVSRKYLTKVKTKLVRQNNKDSAHWTCSCSHFITSCFSLCVFNTICLYMNIAFSHISPPYYFSSLYIVG